ncbi:MAG: NAD(P)-dependent dehydrogenase (short-subunit alcohol dehydrogenase family) [Enterobacterales bacterium]|jgi:NAD(P)-dependent dehydrogenase (short-subunit alcohol dehydrogenase family)
MINNDDIVLITGASRGIGAATARLFAKNNYKICINYRNDSDSASSLANEIKQSGGQCITVQADVSVEDEVIRLFETVDQELGTLSVLVNNAGVLRKQSRLDAMTAERINHLLTSNVTSQFLCCREAVKRMSTKYHGRGGNIINISSGASRTGSPNEYTDYAATKGAIDTLTIGLSKEVAAEKIRVNCVRPGLIYTDMHADGGEADRVERLKSKIPMQRGGNPAEVAEAIYWLGSDKSSFTTGSFIDVTGGL